MVKLEKSACNWKNLGRFELEKFPIKDQHKNDGIKEIFNRF